MCIIFEIFSRQLIFAFNSLSLHVLRSYKKTYNIRNNWNVCKLNNIGWYCCVLDDRDGSVIVSFLVSLDEAATNETESSVQSVLQSELTANSTGVSLGQYELSGNRLTAVTIKGKTMTIQSSPKCVNFGEYVRAKTLRLELGWGSRKINTWPSKNQQDGFPN